MFEKTLPEKIKAILKKITPLVNANKFYLAGGTGLALQIGHRISQDLDFFSDASFDPNSLFLFLKSKTDSQEEVIIETYKLLVTLEGVRCSFIYYDIPLIYEKIIFEDLPVADWRDIIAEKFKTVSQKGSKKDFYDIFSVIRMKKLTIEQAITIFKKRFENTGLNFYHVLRSLTYFEDADEDPIPNMLEKYNFPWEEVKSFFIMNIKEFEKHFSN